VEPAIVPVAIVPEQAPLAELIAQALMNRPELAENRALIGATLERWRSAKMGPLVPNLQLSLDAGGFGGGPNAFFGNFNGRQDFAIAAIMELKNFGLGDLALMRERRSQYNQAVIRQSGIQADVVAEVAQAFSVSYARLRELPAAQRAVVAARESFRLNEQRIRRAPEQARPIELLQAEQALAKARNDYLKAVADWGGGQFRLYTALGNPPLCALESMVTIPVKESTIPAPPSNADQLPKPKPIEPEK
jgi:outer membrane protein TolC